jgi:hypothetical protein
VIQRRHCRSRRASRQGGHERDPPDGDLPGQETKDEMTVEAVLRVIDHRACFGFPALREYLLVDAVACPP